MRRGFSYSGFFFLSFPASGIHLWCVWVYVSQLEDVFAITDRIWRIWSLWWTRYREFAQNKVSKVVLKPPAVKCLRHHPSANPTIPKFLSLLLPDVKAPPSMHLMKAARSNYQPRLKQSHSRHSLHSLCIQIPIIHHSSPAHAHHHTHSSLTYTAHFTLPTHNTHSSYYYSPFIILHY